MIGSLIFGERRCVIRELKLEILSEYISENICIFPYYSYPTSFCYFTMNPELTFKITFFLATT